MGNDGRRGEAIVDTPFSYETRILLFLPAATKLWPR